MSAKIDAVPTVKIDDEGVYKYIQIKISDETKNRQKIIIRGFGYADYHADILDEEQKGLAALGLSAKCIGGGRIRKEGKTVVVYGYSIGFGRCDHNLTAEAIKAFDPDLEVTWNNDGY